MITLISLVTVTLVYYIFCHHRILNWVDDHKHSSFLEKWALPIFVTFVILSIVSILVRSTLCPLLG